MAFTFGLQLLSSTLIWVLLFCSAAWLSAEYYRHTGAYEAILGFIPYFFLINIFQVSTNFFMGFEEPKVVKVMEFLRQFFLFWALLAATLAYGLSLSLAVDIYMWSLGVVSLGIVGALLYRFGMIFRTHGWSLDRGECREITKYALWVLFTANVGVVLSQIDMQLITGIMGIESAAHYGMYLSLISIPFIISGPIIGLYIPYVARIFAEKKTELLANSYRIFLSYILMFAIWVSVFFFLWAPHIAFVLFGQEYIISGDILRVSSVFLFLNFLLQVDFATLAWVGRIQVRAKALFAGLIWNIPATLIGMHYFGLIGAALGVCSAWLIIAIVAHRSLPFEREIWPDTSIITRTLLWCGIASGLFWVLWYFGGWHPIETLPRKSALFELGSLMLLFILSFVCVHIRDVRGLLSLFRH